MGDWLGTGTVASHLRQYRPFEEARSFARSQGLRSGKEWREFIQSGRLPADIPANPNKTYKDAGWAGMGDWLGTGTVASTCASIARSRRPAPSPAPRGSGRGRNGGVQQVRPAPRRHSGQARQDLQGRGLGRDGRLARDGNGCVSLAPVSSVRGGPLLRPLTGLRSRRSGGSSPSPAGSRRHSGQARPDLQGRGLGRDGRLARDRDHCLLPPAVSSIRGGPLLRPLPGAQVAKEWRAFVQSGRLPADIPAKPDKTYKDAGWAGMGDWLGTGTVADAPPAVSSVRGGPLLRPLPGAQVVEGVAEVRQVRRLPADIPAHHRRPTRTRAGRAGRLARAFPATSSASTCSIAYCSRPARAWIAQSRPAHRTEGSRGRPASANACSTSRMRCLGRLRRWSGQHRPQRRV